MAVKFIKGRTRGRVIGWAIEMPNGDIAVKEFDTAKKKRKKSTRRRSPAQRAADKRRSAAMKRCWGTKRRRR